MLFLTLSEIVSGLALKIDEDWLLLYADGMIDKCRCCTQCFHE